MNVLGRTQPDRRHLQLVLAKRVVDNLRAGPLHVRTQGVSNDTIEQVEKLQWVEHIQIQVLTVGSKCNCLSNWSEFDAREVRLCVQTLQ